MCKNRSELGTLTLLKMKIGFLINSNHVIDVRIINVHKHKLVQRFVYQTSGSTKKINKLVKYILSARAKNEINSKNIKKRRQTLITNI